MNYSLDYNAYRMGNYSNPDISDNNLLLLFYIVDFE